MIQKEKGLEVETQKLILKGKAADNDATLEGLGVKEGDFFVVMVGKV